MNCPEHEKLHAIKEHSQLIGEFLDWIPYTLCEFVEGEYVPAVVSIEKILADFFGIDLDVLDHEKREMLAEIRGNTPKARAELGLSTEVDTSREP